MRERNRDCALIAAVALLPIAVIRPLQNSPFVDDWVYAWPVRHLFESGELRIPQFAAQLNLVQILWGAAFCVPFGFSFTALRLSTLMLSISALCAVYLLLRDLRAPRHAALLGAAMVGVYPVFFALSATFMTDVPFVAAMLWTILVFIRGFERRAAVLIWLASLICWAAIAIRFVGAGVAVAMIVTLVVHGGRWGRRPGVWLGPALALAFAAALLPWSAAHSFGFTDPTWGRGATQHLSELRYALPLLPRMLVVTLLFVVSLLGLAMAPLAVGAWSRAAAARAAFAAGVLGAIWLAAEKAGLELWTPLAPGQTWAIDELGATAALVPGGSGSGFQFPLWAGRMTLGLGLGLGAALLASIPRQPLRDGEKALLWIFAGQFALVALLWLTYDRYGLVFVPLAVVLFLARLPRLRIAPAVVGLVLFAGLSAVGLRDHLAYNRALWSAVDDLRGRGVPVSEIDGGYVVNGWLQYTHPDLAHRGPDGRISIPFHPGALRLRYTVANEPRSGATIVREIPYSGWLRSSGRLYVLAE